MKEPSYAILGLGRFGRKLTTLLASTGAEIIIADQDNDIINQFAEYAAYAVCLDLSNTAALQEIGLEHTDIAVVDVSHHLEAAIMAIMVARELGVERIVATASTDRFGEILKKVGADEVVIPEDEAAIRMAKRLISEDFMEYYDMGSNFCIIKIPPKKNWIGKSLKKLRLPEKEHVKIVAIEENGAISMDISSETILKESSALILALRKGDIFNFV